MIKLRHWLPIWLEMVVWFQSFLEEKKIIMFDTWRIFSETKCYTSMSSNSNHRILNSIMVEVIFVDSKTPMFLKQGRWINIYFYISIKEAKFSTKKSLSNELLLLFLPPWTYRLVPTNAQAWLSLGQGAINSIYTIDSFWSINYFLSLLQPMEPTHWSFHCSEEEGIWSAHLLNKLHKYLDTIDGNYHSIMLRILFHELVSSNSRGKLKSTAEI
jgi:hypothetical protein